MALTTVASASEVVDFWQTAGRDLWFEADASFDAEFRSTFIAAHEAAAAGQLRHWSSSPQGALGLCILLDQFPRNAFRGTSRAYATDAQALDVARAAVAMGFDRMVAPELALFFYLPFSHAERLEDQQLAVACTTRLGRPDLTWAEHHRDIIARFGRFPHRNHILGRASTSEEQRFLETQGAFR